jgi:hypothetical protein
MSGGFFRFLNHRIILESLESPNMYCMSTLGIGIKSLCEKN